MKKDKTNLSIIIWTLSIYSLIFLITISAGKYLLKVQTESWGDLFSLGQFLTDLILIPLAFFAFRSTLNELKKSREVADLYVEWEETDKTEYSQLVTRNQIATYQTKNLFLGNKGTSPSTLYQINLEIPKFYGRIQMNNSESGGEWKGSETSGFIKRSFTSSSHLTSFPHAPNINLGRISFLEPEKLPTIIVISYYIASDKSEFKSGILTINLKEINENKK